MIIILKCDASALEAGCECKDGRVRIFRKAYSDEVAGPTYDEDQSIIKIVASEVPIRLKECPVIQDHFGL